MSTNMIRALALVALSGVACADTATHTLEATTATEITPLGGTAKSPNGEMSLVFAASALARTTTVLITEDRTESPIRGLVTPVYHLRPAGTQTPSGLVMRMQVPPASRDHELHVVEVDGAISRQLDGAVLSPDHTTIEAPVLYFSSYALLDEQATVDGGPAFSDAWVPSSCEGDGGLYLATGQVKPCGIQESEPNDSPSAAQPIVGGLDQAAAVNATYDGNDDYYRLTIPYGATGGFYAFISRQLDYSNCVGLSLSLTLLDPSGIVIVSGADCEGLNVWGDPRVNDLPGGDYYVRITGTHAPQPYYLEIFLLSYPNTPHDIDAGPGD